MYVVMDAKSACLHAVDAVVVTADRHLLKWDILIRFHVDLLFLEHRSLVSSFTRCASLLISRSGNCCVIPQVDILYVLLWVSPLWN